MADVIHLSTYFYFLQELDDLCIVISLSCVLALYRKVEEL